MDIYIYLQILIFSKAPSIKEQYSRNYISLHVVAHSYLPIATIFAFFVAVWVQ